MSKLLAALFLALSSSSFAGLRLPALISDHMLLQRDVSARIWGWDAPGTVVTATIDGKSAKAVAGADGAFSLMLPKHKAGGPYDLKISASEERVIADVLYGDVWLASGQSNMEFAMAATHDAATELPAANRPQIRLFQLERHTSGAPESDCRGSWKVSDPQSASGFSAVAYHFAKNVQPAIKAPVGMIASSWGGTMAEAWTPRAALDAVPELAAQAKALSSNPAEVEVWSKGLDFELEVKDLKILNAKGKPLPLFKPTASGWGHSEKPGSKVELKPQDRAARYTGNVEGGGWASLSYQPAGSAGSLDLAQAAAISFLARGKGSASLLVHPMNAGDWDDFGSPKFDLSSEWKKVEVPLASLKQGGWGKPRPSNDLNAIQSFNFALTVPYWPGIPAYAYNGMIAPLTPYAIKGALWYQGESNAGQAQLYASLLGTLIKSWRTAFGQGDFPFVIVQLPDYADEGGTWPALRAAQAKVAATVKNAGMIETMGLGEAHDVHPRNKNEVGRRLAKLALKKVYGKK